MIMIVCGIPGSALPKNPILIIPHLDKFVHAFLYFPLAVILGAEFDLAKKKYLVWAGPVFTLMIIAFYGGMIEILQGTLFVNRSADIFDFLSDVIGGLAGLAVYYLFLRPFFHRISAPKS